MFNLCLKARSEGAKAHVSQDKTSSLWLSHVNIALGDIYSVYNGYIVFLERLQMQTVCFQVVLEKNLLY